MPKSKLTAVELAQLDTKLSKQVHRLALDRGYGKGIYAVLGNTLEKMNALAKSGKSIHIDVKSFEEKDFAARKVGKNTWTAKKKSPKKR